MVSGQWLTVDLGTATSFKELRMDSAGSANDYARGYQILASNDGVNWSSPVASGTGWGALVTATFPVQNARYVRAEPVQLKRHLGPSDPGGPRFQ
jgi:beta-glucosidase